MARRSAIRRVEGLGKLRQGRRGAVLRTAVHARAVEDGGGVMPASAYLADAAWLDASRPVPDVRTSLPGPRASAIYERDQRVTSPSLPRASPRRPQRGSGAVMEDADGNLSLDFNAGIAVNSTGHCHPKVVAAIQSQAADLLHYSASDFYLPIYSQMCEALAATAPMSGPVRVFLTNSGAEAVEGALKLVRYATGRPNGISFLCPVPCPTYVSGTAPP